MSIPANLKYTKDHEWALVEGSTITVGITDHAQKELGDVVFVDLPPVGKEVTKGSTFGVVESIKAVSDLYSPVAGKIVETNATLKDEPAMVNQDPYGKAWMVRLELKDAGALSEMMDAGAYTKYVEGLK